MSYTTSAWAWGGRGHDTICQSAVHLVQDKNLKAFLLYRPHVLGHLCNVPDVYWKSMTAEYTKEGNPTHYISSEMLGISLRYLPLDLTALTTKYNGTESKTKPGVKIVNLPYDMGTSWWRANQLYQMAVSSGRKVKAQSLPAPTNSKEQQDNNLPYNKAIYDMMVYMGIMGHFVGDNSQPFHNNDDHDGYAAGHGGIHSYYEEQTVAFFEADLSSRIVAKANSMKKDPKQIPYMYEKTPLEKMRALSQIAFDEVGAVLKADPILTPSVYKEEHGMKLRTPATRKSAEIGQKAFAPIIVTQMGRSALLLAQLWDQIYATAGKPDLAPYKSYRYPLTPDFIMPDYYEIAQTTPETPSVVPAPAAAQ